MRMENVDVEVLTSAENALARVFQFGRVLSLCRFVWSLGRFESCAGRLESIEIFL